MTLYNLRTEGPSFRITKFTNDLDVESTYLTGFTECECPAGSRPTCRHRLMFADILPLADTAYFWDFDNRLIVDADGEPATYGEVEASRNDPGLDAEGPLSGVTVVPDTFLEIASPSDFREGADLAANLDLKEVMPKTTVTPAEPRIMKQIGNWRRI